MKKILAVLLTLVLVFSLCACGGSGNDENVIRVGATPAPHAEVLELIKDDLEKEGYTLEIVEYNDYVLPNRGVTEGDLD